MDDLIKCLSEFTWAHRMEALWGDEGYKEASLSIEAQTERVKGYLTPEQRRELIGLLDAMGRQDAIANEHLFRAALRLSRELNALARA